MCMSWFEAATKLPLSVTQVAPEGYELDQEALRKLNTGAVGKIAVSHDLDSLLAKADVI